MVLLGRLFPKTIGFTHGWTRTSHVNSRYFVPKYRLKCNRRLGKLLKKWKEYEKSIYWYLDHNKCLNGPPPACIQGVIQYNLFRKTVFNIVWSTLPSPPWSWFLIQQWTYVHLGVRGLSRSPIKNSHKGLDKGYVAPNSLWISGDFQRHCVRSLWSNFWYVW